jgi:hypothetical protein
LPAVFKTQRGLHGRIEIVDLGAVIGETISWVLTRRGNDENRRDPEAEFFDFRADLRFVNEALFNDDEYEKKVYINGGKGQSYLLEPVPGKGQRTALTGRSLVMERIKLCRQ